MARKYNIEDVKKYVEEKSNGECQVLSKEYKNFSSPLLLKCKCGNTFEKSFERIKTGRLCCKECLYKESRERYSYKLEDVKKIIEEKGCKYIGGEYKNNNSILTIQCKCGEIFKKSFRNFYNKGQSRCPKCGKELSRKAKYKYDLEKVKEMFAKNNYTILEDKYVNCETPMKCRCEEGHIFYVRLNDFLYGNQGCKQCAILRNSGENHWNYKGGESEVIDYFRKHIKDWKTEVMIKYKDKCYLTGSKSDCVVHHLKSFNTIIDESLKELNLPLHRKINEYTEEEFNKLKDLVLSKHIVDNGVLLQRKVHNKFHSIYGKGNNTKEQFNEFIKKYYPNKDLLP